MVLIVGIMPCAGFSGRALTTRLFQMRMENITKWSPDSKHCDGKFQSFEDVNHRGQRARISDSPDIRNKLPFHRMDGI